MLIDTCIEIFPAEYCVATVAGCVPNLGAKSNNKNNGARSFWTCSYPLLHGGSSIPVGCLVPTPISQSRANSLSVLASAPNASQGAISYRM